MQMEPRNYHRNAPLRRPVRRHRYRLAFILLAAIIGVTGLLLWRHLSAKDPTPALPKTTVVTPVKPAPSVCTADMDQSEIVVSIGKQHLWACNGSTQLYDTDVTTGAYKIDDDATPTGTWHIYAKETDRYLNGSDAHGSWHDYVKYWMPFNGDYGFHDATWQTFPFGDLKQYGTQGSHGCVHLPDEAAAWLYNWASVGTTVQVQA